MYRKSLGGRKTKKRYSKKTKGGVNTRRQKRRIETGLPAVEEKKSSPKNTKRKVKDPEELKEAKSQTVKPKTKKPTTKKERREARERLPSVQKKKTEALERKIAKERVATRKKKLLRDKRMQGFKLRRFLKVQESRKKKPKKPSIFPTTFRNRSRSLSPIKESPKSSSPKEYSSTLDKQILEGLQKGLTGLKM